MKSLTSTSFKEAVKSGIVLVDFYADRCGPCQALKPYLEGMEADYAGKVSFYQVDVDAEYQLAGEQGITAMPTIKIFKDGELQKLVRGADIKSIHEGLQALFVQ